MHLRALKVLAEDLKMFNCTTYLAGNPKRKEWGSSCWHSLIYEPTYKVPSNVNRMSIYVKHKQKANGIMRLIKGIKENRRKGLGVSLGPKVWRLRVRGSEDLKTSNITWCHETDEVSQARRFEDFEDSSKASKTLQWLHEGFPLTKLSQMIPVYNVDRTLNKAGSIHKVMDMIMTYSGHLEQILLMVTQLGKQSIILGFSWLKKHNPKIDFCASTIKMTRCLPHCCVGCKAEWKTEWDAKKREA